MGSVDANTGLFIEHEFDDPDTDPYEAVKYAQASAAIPMLWPPVLDGDMTLVDGGVAWIVDIAGPINKCRDLGFEDKDIVLDTILCSENHIRSKDGLEDWKTLKHGLRAWEIQSYYKGMADVEFYD